MSEAALKTPEKEPTYVVTELFPYQGDWTEADYLDLTAATNRLIELSDGRLDVLPMPSVRHQKLVRFLFRLLDAFVFREKLGEVLFAPLRVKLWESKFREPDIVFMFAERAKEQAEGFWQGADLVVEVISPDDPKRDTEDKWQEYAQAGITEYWLVDPRDDSLSIYTLPASAGSYTELSKQTSGKACSELLDGFCVDVGSLFEA